MWCGFFHCQSDGGGFYHNISREASDPIQHFGFQACSLIENVHFMYSTIPCSFFEVLLPWFQNKSSQTLQVWEKELSWMRQVPINTFQEAFSFLHLFLDGKCPQLGFHISYHGSLLNTFPSANTFSGCWKSCTHHQMQFPLFHQWDVATINVSLIQYRLIAVVDMRM